MACDRVLVVGVGNRMYGDDAFGPAMIDALRRCGFPCDTADSDGGLFFLASLLEDKELVVFIDILDEEYGSPGDVVTLTLNPSRLSGEDYARLFSMETSPHTVTPAHIVAVAYSGGIFRGKAVVVGVVSTATGFAQPLSDTVKKRVVDVCEKVSEILKVRFDCSCVGKILGVT